MTLLRVLLLMLFIAIGVALCLANQVPHREGQQLASQEAKRFIRTIQHAREQALREGVELGLHIGSDGYGLTRQKGQDWEPIGALHRMSLSLRLDIDHRPVSLATPAQLSVTGDAQHGFVLYFEDAGARLACVASDGPGDPRLAC